MKPDSVSWGIYSWGRNKGPTRLGADARVDVWAVGAARARRDVANTNTTDIMDKNRILAQSAAREGMNLE